MSGNMFVISGPSGVGKSTVLKEVLKQSPDLHFSISATTRPIRPSEIDGVNYYFVTHEKFRQMIQDDALLEYAEYVGNYYGTPVAPLDEAVARGQDVLLDIEVQGGMNTRRLRPETVLIFLAAPSFQELERRLRSRGDTSPELVEQRLARARWEYAQAPKYDYIVVNNSVEAAAKEILSILAAEKCRTKHRMNYLKEDYSYALPLDV